MAESTLILTFQDLILRAAEHLGIAEYPVDVAVVPTDAHNLDRCKRIVNDGWRRFINTNPQWNWMSPNFTILLDPDGTGGQVVNSEAWRYYMPDGFYGHMIGRLTFPNDYGNAIAIRETTEQEIRELRASGDITGDPRRYAIRPLADDPRARWEWICWPTPGTATTVTGRCRIYGNKLVELTDRPNAGVQFDEAILAAVLAEAERQVEDNSGVMESHWAEALTRAVAIDQQTAPRTVGYNDDTSDGANLARRSWYTGPGTYTNVDGTVHTL